MILDSSLNGKFRKVTMEDICLGDPLGNTETSNYPSNSLGRKTKIGAYRRVPADLKWYSHIEENTDKVCKLVALSSVGTKLSSSK